MSKPILILIHGYPFDQTLWELVAPALRNKARVVTPDLPGFGSRAFQQQKTISIDDMADEALRDARLGEHEKAIVGGMSMGGYVALSIAERYPEKVAGLALISTHAWADTDEARKGRMEMIEKVRKEGAQAAAVAAIPKLFAPAHAGQEKFRKYPLEGAARAGVAGICAALDAMAKRPDRSHVLKRIDVPVLVLHGAEDKFIPTERARQMAALHLDAEYEEIAAAGHGLPVEAPTAVVQSLSRLLKRVEDAARAATHRGPAITISPNERGL